MVKARQLPDIEDGQSEKSFNHAKRLLKKQKDQPHSKAGQTYLQTTSITLFGRCILAQLAQLHTQLAILELHHDHPQKQHTTEVKFCVL